MNADDLNVMYVIKNRAKLLKFKWLILTVNYWKYMYFLTLSVLNALVLFG